MPEERELKARLEIETEGSFAEPRQDLERLPEAGDAAQEVLRRLVEEVERIGSATSFDELLERIRTFGREGAEELRKVAAEAQDAGEDVRDLVQAARMLEAAGRLAGDPVALSLARAEQAAVDLFKVLQTGGAGAQQRLVRLRVAIEQYRSEVEKARSAGRPVTAEDGEALARLVDGYEEGVAAAARYRTAQQQVADAVANSTEATRQQVNQVSSLGDVFTAVNPKLGSFFSRLSAGLSAVQVARGALQSLEDRFNSLGETITGQEDSFEGIFTDFIPGTTQVINRQAEGLANLDRAWAAFLDGDLRRADMFIAGLGDTVAEQTSLMALWRANGLDPTGKSVEELTAKVPELTERFRSLREGLSEFIAPNAATQNELRKTSEEFVRLVEVLRRNGRLEDVEVFGRVRQRLAELVAEFEEAGLDLSPALAQLSEELDASGVDFERWVERVGVSVDQLGEHADAFAARVERFAAENERLEPPQLAALFGGELQRFLDQFDRLEAELPPRLERLADAWGVTTTAAERAAAQHERVVGSLLERIGGVVRENREQLARELAALPEVLGQIDLSRLRFEDPEQFERARQLVDGYVEAFRRLGLAVPEAVQSAAGAFGILIKQNDLTAEAQQRYAAAQDQASGSAVELIRNTEGVVVGLRSVEAGLDGASAGAVELVRNAEGVVTGMRSVEDASGSAGEAATKLGDEQKAAGEKANEAAGSLEGAAERTATATESLGEQAEAASAAGEQLGSAAGASEELGNAQERARESLAATSEEVGQLETRLDSLGEKAGQASAAIATAFEDAASAPDRLNEALDGTITRLQTAIALSRQLANLGEGATAAPAA